MRHPPRRTKQRHQIPALRLPEDRRGRRVDAVAHVDDARLHVGDAGDAGGRAGVARGEVAGGAAGEGGGVDDQAGDGRARGGDELEAGEGEGGGGGGEEEEEGPRRWEAGGRWSHGGDAGDGRGRGEEVAGEGWVAGKVGRSVGGGLLVGWAGQSFRDPYTCTPGWARIRGGERRDPWAQRPRGEFVGRGDGLAEEPETGCVSEVRGGGRRDDGGSAMMQSQESSWSMRLCGGGVGFNQFGSCLGCHTRRVGGGDRLKDGVRESATSFSGEPGGRANQVGWDI